MHNKRILFPTLFPIMFLAILLSALPVAFAHAATQFYFQVPTSSVVAGEAFPVRVLLDSDQPANAYDISVNFSGPVTLQDVNNANSLITVSASTPDLSQGGQVSWHGGSVVAFSGTGGTIFTLDFLASGSGKVSLSFNEGAIYLANGKGTKVIPAMLPATMSIVASSTLAPGAVLGIETQNLPTDVIPPQIDFLLIIQDPFNANQKLLSFAAHDNGSGIRTMEMRYRTWFSWSPWQTIQNPAALPNAWANDAWEVDFKAVDNVGNMAEEFVYDWTAFAYSIGISLLVIVLILAALYFFIHRRRTSSTQ